MTKLLRKLALLLDRNRFRSELDEEMAFHRAEAEQNLIASGMSPKAARRAAKRQFGNVARLREESHEAVAFRIETVWQDLRYALRQMLRAPGFTLAVILTLALGVGANTAIFSVVQATLLRPLPYPDAERIVAIKDERTEGPSPGGLMSVPRFFDIAERTQSFEKLTTFYFDKPSMIDGAHAPENLSGVGIIGPFWSLFGVQPLLGRFFEEDQAHPNAGSVAVLSYAAWRRLFASDRNIVGKAVSLDKHTATIIGVAPAGFSYPRGVDIYRPSHFSPSDWKGYRGDGTRFVNTFGLIKQGIPLATAQSELRILATQLASEHPSSDAPWRFTGQTLREYTFGTLRPVLLVLLAASAVLLLIACLNVANLLLSRATARQREVALRQALGASRMRIVRQLITESLLLALFGGGTGLAAAAALVRFAGTRLPGALRVGGASGQGVTLDWPVVLFALGVTLAAGLLFGLAPVVSSRRGNLTEALKVGEARAASAHGNRMRSAFIALQVALSLMLLVSACLLTESLWKLTRSPLGFTPEHVLTFETSLWMLNGNAAPVDRFYDEVQRHLESLPGVTAVGQISALPTVSWHLRSSYGADWMPQTDHRDSVYAENRHIAGNYLEAMQIPLLAGRELRPDDGLDVLVNQEFVRQYSPDSSPVGRHLLNDHTISIVGIIGNVRGTAGSIAEPVQPEIYWPAAGLGQRSFAVRSQLPTAQLLPLVINAVRQVDPQQAIGKVQTLDDLLSIDTAQPRLNMALLVSLAAIALALSCVGIYGVVAYSVAQRRQEIGVRMALGASRIQISALFLKRTFTSALVGLAVGGVATLPLTHLLRSQLYGIQPNDPTTFSIATLLLLAPVFAASLRPALQAASVDPMEALRTE